MSNGWEGVDKSAAMSAPPCLPVAPVTTSLRRMEAMVFALSRSSKMVMLLGVLCDNFRVDAQLIVVSIDEYWSSRPSYDVQYVDQVQDGMIWHITLD